MTSSKKQLKANLPRAIIEAIIAATFQGKAELATDIAPHLSSEHALIRHTAYRALAKLGASRSRTGQSSFQ